MPTPATPKRSTILAPVFYPAIAVIALLVIGTIAQPQRAAELFGHMLSYFTTNFGWFYMLSVAVFLVFIVIVALSKWGHIKLGPDHAEPEYSFPAWFAMLFSTGYGVALLFFGVAEPVLHYASPPAGAALTLDSAQQAMQIAFFHWGFHIWAIYGLVGLVLSYFAFRHGLPLSMRSALYPIFGERIHGPVGHVVDVAALLGTMFGIATTLGLSVIQINTGLHYLWPDIPVSVGVQVIAIAIISGLATISVAAGMDKGIKRLSMINIVLALALMIFVFVTGPSVFILETFLQNTGSYLNNIVARTFNLQAYSRTDWIGNWTLFIFGWTIAWAPFVGLFIAKISRGRTIREFVFGVMLVPAFFTFLWFSVFGDTALHLIIVDGYTELISQVQQDEAIALFKLFEQLPLTKLVSFVAVVLISIFFVTSADSGALVMDSLASGGTPVTPVWQRIFWSATAGVVASVLLLAGGLKALQAMTVATALPFAIIMLMAAAGMWRAMVIEGHQETSLQTDNKKNTGANLPWKKRLLRLIDYPTREPVAQFISSTVLQSLYRVRYGLLEQGWPAEVVFDEESVRAWIEVVKEDKVDFLYEVRLRAHPRPDFAEQQDDTDDSIDPNYYRAEVFLRRGGQSYDLFGYEGQDVIRDVLDQFENYLQFLDVSPGSLPWKRFNVDTPYTDGNGDQPDPNTPAS
ncbi:BCCT family transporter [Isoalcanivorax beigongshangi]|uniref:BCCT family transporter n=1 Tax=Isoalcanivorax beigongshangi TaxID=3238810 RepID=A0ABV4AGT6_9GAMM